MNNFCSNCKEEKCSSMGCEHYFKCKCKCSKNSAVDITMKLATFLSSIMMIIGSYSYLNEYRKPEILIPQNILYFMGSNFILSKTSFFLVERIFMDEIIIDSAFDALTGLIYGI